MSNKIHSKASRTPTESSFLLIGNASYQNRGCEAIVRGTAAILEAAVAPHRLTLTNAFYGNEHDAVWQKTSEEDARIEHVRLAGYPRKWTREWVEDRLNRALGTNFTSVHRPLLRAAATAACALEIGGDNYTLDYGFPEHLVTMDRWLMRKGKPVIIWGASVGPFNDLPTYETKVLMHFRSLPGVLVRERESYNYLVHDHHLENVYLHSDPAFVMNEVQPLDESICARISPAPIILNISPLLFAYVSSKRKMPWQTTREDLEPHIQQAVTIVVGLQRATGLPILLLPHVYSSYPGIDDYSFLRTVYEECRRRGVEGVGVVDEKIGARELKWLIARSRAVVAARTHATIAGISTCVPTISLGYSRKAIGINQDVFGSQQYCIMARDLEPEHIIERVQHILSKEAEIRALLAKRVPKLKASALGAGTTLRELLAAREGNRPTGAMRHRGTDAAESNRLLSGKSADLMSDLATSNATASEETSYEQVVASSSILGGTQAIIYAISLLKTKIAAVLLGPAGVGMVGLFQSATSMVATVTGLGLNTSGVREVSDAASSGDAARVARTVKVLRRLCWVTGALGWLLTVAMAWPLSVWTFGDGEHTLAISILGCTVLVGAVTGGQIALLQGMRCIGDLARVNLLCVIGGTAASIVLFAWLGMRGIVPALVVSALINLFFNWRYSRKLVVEECAISWFETFQHSGRLLRLGVAMMWNGLLITGVALVTRALIVRNFGIAAGGFYQAAWGLSGVFSGFILSAMSADFYPRLSASSKDAAKMNRLVNEQTEIGVLLALPGLLATLVFSPLLIELLYTSKFAPAAELLPWFVLGVLVQVTSWPIGFILLAKGASGTFAAVETLLNTAQLILTFCFLRIFGLTGAALAFVATGALHILLYFAVCRRSNGFRWTREAVAVGALSLTTVVAAILLHLLCAHWLRYFIGTAMVTGSAYYSLVGIDNRLDPSSKIAKLLRRLPITMQLLRVRR